VTSAERTGTRAPPWTFDSRVVRSALGISHEGHGPAHDYTGASTDTRTLQPGELFVAVRGDRFDASDFLAQAAERGAPGAIVPIGREDRDLPLEYFPVPDPVLALGSLAACARRSAAVRVVGITGSSGKTTVKEMVACALSADRGVYRTEGNLNSQIGLPLMILRAPGDADTWVLEMGASEPGEIPRLVEIARPDDAIITTVGPAHLEQFHDEATVLREKLSLVSGASPDGVVVVGEQPPVLACEARRLRPDTIVAGIGDDADYAPDRYGVEAERVWFERGGVRFDVEVGGEHHLRDALIAAALSESLGAAPEATARGLSEYRAVGMRGVLQQLGDLTVFADCYNANPESFNAAIDYCRSLFPGRRLAAFVGTMLELGDAEEGAHREIADRLVDAGFAIIAATGAFATAARAIGEVNGTRFMLATDPAKAWEPFASALQGDELVLVKGSRGVRLEGIVERLVARFNPAPEGT
jgi:UDP-N-acetylmuramoyl-tripeptide--D-alanyl-D-alanine ligase